MRFVVVNFPNQKVNFKVIAEKLSGLLRKNLEYQLANEK